MEITNKKGVQTKLKIRYVKLRFQKEKLRCNKKRKRKKERNDGSK